MITSFSLNLDTLLSTAVSVPFSHHSTWDIRVIKRRPNYVGDTGLHHGTRFQAVE